MRALVTGATGGLGRALVPRLSEAGFSVLATGRDETIGRTLGAPFVGADLTKPLPASLLEGCDIVFHLAALSAPFGPQEAFRAINVEATRRLLEAARDAGCRRFVHVSSPSIYAAFRDRLALREDAEPARPFLNAYASTKYEAERLVSAADDPKGMRTTIIRPRAIVGPHDTVLLPRLIHAARRGRLPLPRGGSALVELTDARDVADALVLAGSVPGAAGRAFNISGGEPRAVRWIAERVAGALGLPVRILPLPMTVARIAGSILEAGGRVSGREPVLTRYSAAMLGHSQTFDLSGARAALGWHPSIPPEEAIDHALAGRRADA